MNKKLTIKTKLLLSTLLIQGLTLLIFSFALYKFLEISTYDKIQTNLKIITLDIIDDIEKHKKLLSNIDLHEAEEFKFKPLYMRIIEPKSLKIIVSTRFPNSIEVEKDKFKNLKLKEIKIEKDDGFVISRTKVKIRKKVELIIEVATTQNILNTTLENLFYILLIIIPIIFILSIIGTIALLNSSFSPVKNILIQLQNIKASNLSKRIQRSHSDDEIDNLSKEINNLIDRVESSFEKIQQFSSDASHELKTPLTIIRGEIEIALNKPRSIEEYKEVLEISLNEVIVIQQTINDLLFLSKTEHENLSFEQIYLDEISQETIEELKPIAKKKNITINCDIKEAIQTLGHGNLLKIAIKNILKNALEFSKKDSKVILKNYSNGNFHIIEIEDFGIGILKEEQNKVFEKFYRTDKSRNKNSGGTGLGMAICKKIIAMHNGEIDIKSEEDIGTIVIIKLPK